MLDGYTKIEKVGLLVAFHYPKRSARIYRWVEHRVRERAYQSWRVQQAALTRVVEAPSFTRVNRGTARACPECGSAWVDLGQCLDCGYDWPAA